MANVLYKRVDYKLENLLLDVETGKLGLPDLQRPFVWQNSKVRDLFDSMMKGYPMGYLMLWDAPSSDSNGGRQIGLDSHPHDTPKQLIIDGQQRLTSLYAVMHGKPPLLTNEARNGFRKSVRYIKTRTAPFHLSANS